MKQKRPYEKPVVVHQEKMVFPMEIMLRSTGGMTRVICRQCSACHGCR
ncbi:MAG: hypothetical protein WC455_24645 [Dehalococcoidia bacterium]